MEETTYEFTTADKILFGAAATSVVLWVRAIRKENRKLKEIEKNMQIAEEFEQMVRDRAVWPTTDNLN